MRDMRGVVDQGQPLVWKQPRASKQEFELWAGEEVVATLRWQRCWGSLAEAISAEESWTFKRVGFWQTKGTIRIAGSEADAAMFDPRWTGGGELRLAAGPTYHWKGTNL